MIAKQNKAGYEGAMTTLGWRMDTITKARVSDRWWKRIISDTGRESKSKTLPTSDIRRIAIE